MRSLALVFVLVFASACANTAETRRAALAAQHEAEKAADVAALRDVTQLLLDVSALHEAAAQACEERRVAELFSDLAARRSRMAEEWQAHVAFVGGDTSALTERAHAALLANTAPTPAAVAAAEDALAAALSNAIQRPGLSAETLAFLQQQLAELRAAAAPLRTLAGLQQASLAATP